MPYFRVFRDKKWPVVWPLQKGRQCPDCLAIVYDRQGQLGHSRWHMQLEEVISGLGDSGAAGLLAAEPGVVLRQHVGVAAEPEGPEGAPGGGDYVASVPQEVGGYVIGNGGLPPETRGGED